MSKHIYIKKNLKSKFMVSDNDITTLNGYEDAVGSSWADYEDGKFLRLSKAQAAFHERYPYTSAREVWEMQLANASTADEEIYDFPDDLNIAKQVVIDRVNHYDSSEIVNTVTINGIVTWFDKNERAQLSRRYELEEIHDIESTSLWIGQTEVKTTPSEAVGMLDSLEMYAAKCYDTTHMHINNIMGISTIDSLKKYNYKDGYPEPLSFSL